jgi:DNA-3-methyladenine glycosylase
MQLLDNDFYLHGHVTEIAQRVLGKLLCTHVDGKRCMSRIVEVEAYEGRNDKACHANNGKRSKRNEMMYAQGGVAYVYLCYGIHAMFNIVTNAEGMADAVLVRAVEPLEGLHWMQERKTGTAERIAAGPGNVCKALGIDLIHNGASLSDDTIWLAEAAHVSPNQIVATTRVGVDYAGEDALRPWRYYIKGHPSVSKK